MKTSLFKLKELHRVKCAAFTELLLMSTSSKKMMSSKGSSMPSVNQICPKRFQHPKTTMLIFYVKYFSALRKQKFKTVVSIPLRFGINLLLEQVN